MHNNINFIHPECAKNRIKQFKEKGGIQRIIEDKETIFNDISNKKFFIKTAIEEDGLAEHIWINVTSIDYKNSTITGTLGNDPFDLKNIKFGDLVTVNFDSIQNMIINDFPFLSLI